MSNRTSPEQKKKKGSGQVYRVHTEAMTGWVYEVRAKTKKEAEDKFYDCDWFNDFEDMDWQGDSNEEVWKVEKVGKNDECRKCGHGKYLLGKCPDHKEGKGGKTK